MRISVWQICPRELFCAAMIYARFLPSAGRKLLRTWFAPLFAFTLTGFCAGAAPLAGVYLGEWPGTDLVLARQIADDIHSAGYATKLIGPETLSNSQSLLSLKLDLLALPQARSLPVTSMDAVRDYLRSGGRMMAFGLPAWDAAAFNFQGKIISRQEYEKILDSQTGDHLIVDFARDLSEWKRSSDRADTRTQKAIVTQDGSKALHVSVDSLVSWDILAGPPLADAFPDGRTLTCFRARGSKDTRAMSIEWDEEDGSRWIATIDLSPAWKSYCLTPELFHAWEPHGGRGGPGDHLDVRHVKRMTVGLARSHSGLPGPHHEYWIGNISTGRSPFAGLPAPDTADAPQIDTLSPGWKFYPMHGALKVATPEGLPFVSRAELEPPDSRDGLPQAMQPRPRGIGFNQERPWRWQPLLEARSPQGDFRGALATMMIHFDDEFRGGIWACFTPSDAAFYRQDSARQLIRETAQTMQRGLFLEEGGSEFFTAFEGQKFAFGARAVNYGNADGANLSVRIAVKSNIGRTTLFAREWPLALAAGAAQTVQQEWIPAEWPRGGLVVVTELLQNGQLIDQLEHELNVWRPKERPEFVEESNGGFLWRGKPWKINGVNYMPATGIGISSGTYFENWLGKGAYDPGAIERDLERIKGMNLNAVSIFVDYPEIGAQHLLDFLRRCDALGLHVNQSLRPGTPLDFQWDKIKAEIESFHLAQNDTVIAYDLAWEAEHHDEQNTYGKDWTAWVNDHYGTAAHAQSVWGVAAPGFDAEGTLLVPPLRELANDGPWRVMVADYRAFLDSILTDKYGEARRLVRSIDHHHAVSFRMNEAGDPTFNSDRRLPFDFYGLARAVDMWAPEAYGRIGDWEHVRQGRFDVDYARLCDPKKPVIWAEMGYSVWDERHDDDSPEKLDFAGTFYRDFYRMMTEAGNDGVFFWWYPGGYRVNEKSDFGIINPDGTDRPVTQIIRTEGLKFLRAAKPPAANYVIKIDRDRDARGLYGIYQAVKNDYWQAIAEGKTPALEWEKEPGKK